jgi:GrpB-like predicted nucleotidyltransferase (UPF0157 family)
VQFFTDEQYQSINIELYDRIVKNLRKQLPDAVIEHIGSSAVPGLVSKGDLDIYVGVERDSFESATSLIEDLGFNIKDGTLRTDNLCPFESKKFNIDVGIQLVVNGSEFEFFRTFRDLLLCDENLRAQYNEIKRSCQEMDEHAYRRIKSEFIVSVLEENSK